MLRAVAMVAVFSGCVWLGVRASSSLKARRDILKALMASFNQLALRMEYTMEPLASLALHCKNEETELLFDAFAASLARQASTHAAWVEAMEEARWSDAKFASLEGPELQVMEEYARSLGEGGQEAHIKNAVLLQKQLASIAENAEKNYTGKGRMYRSMGILSGVAVAILLL